MSIRRSLAWSYGGQAFVFAVTFVSSVIVARILGPYEMGIFAIAMATAGLLSILSSFGVGPYLVRHETLDRDTIATVFTVNAILNLIISSAMLTAVALGGVLHFNESVRRVLAIIAISPLIGIFEFIPSTLLQREMRFRALAVISMGRVIVSSVAVVTFATAGYGAVSPACAILAAAIYGCIAANVFGWRNVTVRPGLTGWRDILAFGIHMMTVGGVASAAQRLSEIAMGKLLGLAALGVYARASSLADQIWSNMYGQATRVIFSQMADEMRDTSTVKKTFLTGISMITAVIWPFLMGLATLSAPTMQLLYGEKWLAAALPLSIMMVAHLIGLCFGMNWELSVLKKRTGWMARIEIMKSLTGSTAFIAGCFAGLSFAAASRVIEALMGLILYGPKMREMADTQPGEISAVFKQSAALTIAAVVPSFVLMCFNDWSASTSWWLISPAVVVGIVLWFAVLRVQRHPLLAEIERIVMRLPFVRGAMAGGPR